MLINSEVVCMCLETGTITKTMITTTRRNYRLVVNKFLKQTEVICPYVVRVNYQN